VVSTIEDVPILSPASSRGPNTTAAPASIEGMPSEVTAERPRGFKTVGPSNFTPEGQRWRTHPPVVSLIVAVELAVTAGCRFTEGERDGIGAVETSTVPWPAAENPAAAS